MAKVPMIVDSGELTMLRELASDMYGRERVDYPEQMPDEVKPKIAEDHEFGYMYALNKDVGRMGRRWLRSDVSILAADFEDGKRTPIPDSGFSDFEAVLDEGTHRVSGDALFQKEITREGLGPLVPFRDFNVGDIWPVQWCGLLELNVPISRIEAISELGAAVDWRVLAGQELIADQAAQLRANDNAARAVELARRQDRAEARKRAEEVRREQQRFARYVDADYKPELKYEPSTFKTTVLDTAQTNAYTQMTEELDEKRRYDKKLETIALQMGGRSNVQEAFATDLWRQNELIQAMRARGVSVEEQASAFATFAAIETALWNNQVEIDREQDRQILQLRELVKAVRYNQPEVFNISASGGTVDGDGANVYVDVNELVIQAKDLPINYSISMLSLIHI